MATLASAANAMTPTLRSSAPKSNHLSEASCCGFLPSTDVSAGVRRQRRRAWPFSIRAKLSGGGENPLQYRKLGDSDLHISEITLGTVFCSYRCYIVVPFALPKCVVFCVRPFNLNPDRSFRVDLNMCTSI